MTTLEVQPPLTRKKLVTEKYNPDTFRVMSIDAEKRLPLFRDRIVYENTFMDPPVYKLPIIHQRETPPILPISSTNRHFRANCPQPMHCGFLRENVSTLNDPVCVAPGLSDPGPWWRHDVDIHRPTPEYTYNTTSRDDYRLKHGTRSTRHGSNPHTEGVLGPVPVNFLKDRHGYPRLWKENMSYEHIYDSRCDPSYPPRGTRQGAFVCNLIPHETAKPLIDRQVELSKTRTSTYENLSNNSIQQSCVENKCQVPKPVKVASKQNDIEEVKNLKS